jgi:hypothetical protein
MPEDILYLPDLEFRSVLIISDEIQKNTFKT